MINTTLMKFSRFVTLVLCSVSLTSCGTLGGLMNSLPFRMLDETGSALLGMLAENQVPVDGKPASIQDRARQVESRGIYAGHAPFAGAPRQSMAAR